MSDHEEPEMLRTPVEELCLQAKSLRLLGDLSGQLKKAIDPPEPLAVENAVELLTELGAFTSDEEMTPLGWQLSQLPVHPCLGKMLLLGSLFTRYGDNQSENNLLPLISICATLSFKSPFVLPFGKEKEADRARKKYGKGLFSDHFLFAKVSEDAARQRSRGELGRWLDDNFLSKKTLDMTEQIKHDLERHLKDLKVVSQDRTPARAYSNRQETAVSLPLLSSILAASLNISFTSPRSRKICSLRGGSSCSVHPSSLLTSLEAAGDERMLWRTYKHLMRSPSPDPVVEKFVLDHPDKLFIVGWFERLKTSDVYLRDCTLFSDPLPLLLFLPSVQNRPKDPTVFEVIGGKASHGGNAEKGDHPTLLLKVNDERSSRLLISLRAGLSALFDALLSTTNTRSPAEGDVEAVFRGLKSLIERSHALYMTDVGKARPGFSDPEVLDVRHLHNSAHCELLSGDDGQDNNSFEDESEDYDLGIDNRWGARSEREPRDSWHGRDDDRYTSWGGRGRPKRGRNSNGWGQGGHGRGGRGGRGGRRW